MSEIHQQRQIAESFGAEAERYDRGRPSYPEAMIKRIVEASPGPDFLDVGIGTGIAARQLRAAGAHVLGVEIDDRMAGQARTHGLDVEVAKFEEWDPEGRHFDAIVAAMTWHWIDPLAGAVKAAEVLEPGGLLALMWNVFEAPPDLKQAFAEISARNLPDFPNPWASPVPMVEGYQAIFDRAKDGLREAGGFGASDQWRIDWDLTYTRDEWLTAMSTFGGASTIATETQTTLRTEIGNAIDAAGGTITIHYSTVTVATKRA